MMSCLILVVLVLVLSSIKDTFAAPVNTNTSRMSSGFQLDMEELQKLGITPEDVVQHIKLLVQGKYVCTGDVSSKTVEKSASMQRHFLRNKTVTCNDGSKAGYYIRKPHKPNARWIIFLEGGWLCFDRKSCQSRWLNTPNLMSSDHWPQTRRGSGILSLDQAENPFISDGNIVYVPYCSSDSWTGTFKSRQKGDFSFMGALIVEEVVEDLFELHGLSTATKVYLAGSSAGGTGVLMNLDRVASLVARLAPSVEVRGISDSGWFLDNRQFKEVECTDAHQCAPVESVQRGIVLWHGLVPEACRTQLSIGEHWKCYFGYRVYTSLTTVVFIVQHLFDEAQITADNVGPPMRKDQWQYIHNIGVDMRNTLANVSAVFAPACLSHILITRSEWRHVTINGASLPDALRCWENGKHEKNMYDRTAGSFSHRLITSEKPRKRDKIQKDQPTVVTRRKTKKIDRKKKKVPTATLR